MAVQFQTSEKSFLTTVFGCFKRDLKSLPIISLNVLFQNFLKEVIKNRDRQQIQATSLEKMREVFEDLLADYRCIGKDVYAIVPPGTFCK